MTVVQELDKTLFDSYVKPKAAIVMGLVRCGILDSDMDWYETPQPTGMLCFLRLCHESWPLTVIIARNPTIYV
jgi:hypothetical protein